jgi:CheY-like chemotaxis protein/two-component sensor histidine kinase
MEVDMAPVALSDIYEDAERAFRQMAEEKGLEFAVQIDPDLPPSIVSDEQRLGQILKNLLSNAFKFTHQGGVTLAINSATGAAAFNTEPLREAQQVISFSVVDTGVGIADDKLEAIFEAFQQADGTTSRKYGGTGLGLSISREIARLLGGEIHAESQPGKGSRFSLYLPLNERVSEAAFDALRVGIEMNGASDANGDGSPSAPADEPPVSDDRDALEAEDRVVLVIDANPDRARMALETVRARGGKGVIARRWSAGPGLAREHRASAVLLAGDVPRSDSLLAQLKKHPDTRHLPVIVLGDPMGRVDALRAGAAAFLDEPFEETKLAGALARLDRLLDSAERRIALIEPEHTLDDQLTTLLSGGGEVQLVRIEPSSALRGLRADAFDLGVVTVGENTDAFALLRDVATDPALRELPLIAYVEEALPKPERARLEALAKAAVITVVDSPERLVDRAALFLHRAEAALPTPTRKLLGQLRTGDAPLQGKKVLVVDDDIRNVFALTSTLEQRGMKVVFAENGREGIERLHQHPNTDLVLLDIMMPEMDGYETAQAIRSMPRFEHLPIISLTAKAMKGDREKAIAAGASDYITKPVDIDQLIAMMRVWLDA